jgi:hydroxymethylpyrimidine pyrophosphatase-like HAD family hydrolase
VQKVPTPVLGLFRAVAVDLDGTLAEHDRVEAETLAALRQVIGRGLRVIAVTGRTLEDLDITYPRLRVELSAVVAENGAVLASPLGIRDLADPVDAAIRSVLDARGVNWTAGRVLLACDGADEAAVAATLRELGLDYELVRNRDALMVLPPGVTKATGLLEALHELGLSPHNTVAIGDAENDHTMLAACELGVAVANAVEALRNRADIVLDLPDGQGVASFLRGGLLRGEERRFPAHWRIELGIDSDGRSVSLPASQLNLIVSGGPGDGKSYLAGLIAEQLALKHYSLVVIDPEGDHVGLERLHSVTVVDAGRVRCSAELLPLLLQGDFSIVVDLSRLDEEAQATLLACLPAEIEAERQQRGLPHWVFIDEAHRPVRRSGVLEALDPFSKGYALVTYRPGELAPDVVASMDAVLALGTTHPDAALVDLTAAVAGVPRARAARVLSGSAGQAVLVWRDRPGKVTVFTPGHRITAHHRHDHKYAVGRLAPDRRFYFRDLTDQLTGSTAGSLAELESVLVACGLNVLRHHCPRHDISRWVADIFGYRQLAGRLAEAEGGMETDSPAAVVEVARARLIAALHSTIY